MTARTLVVVTAGLSTPSSTRLLADRLAVATTDVLREDGVEVRTVVVDLRDHAHALTDHLLTGFAGPALREALDAVARADAVLAVSPIFSASYSGLFKTFFDVLDDGALAGTPVLLGATAGTARHSLALEHALRPLFSYLGALVAPTAVFAASDDWGAGDTAGARALGERVDRAARELAGLMALPRRTRAADPFADPTPFAQLLAG